jgi:hypothetical protein
VVDRYPTPTWRISLGLGKSHSPGVQGLLPHIRLDACSCRDVIRPSACTYAL